MKSFLCGILSVLVCATSVGSTLTPTQKADEIRYLATIIKSQYGPRDFKNSLFGIDVDTLANSYITAAQSTDNLEYYYLMNKFVAEFHDSHFFSTLNTDHRSLLGFTTDRIENKVVIDTIDRTILPTSTFPFNRGDEVIQIGGQPVDTVVNELASYRGSGTTLTALRAASRLISNRDSRFVPPQYGPVTVQIHSKAQGVTYNVFMQWLHTGTLLESQQLVSNVAEVNRTAKTDYTDLSIREYISAFPKTDNSYQCNPGTRIQIPAGSTIISMTPFVSYYHPTTEGNVGYVRIPHYFWDDLDLAFSQYETVINIMEQNTVGLIIDQDHNCGGSAPFVDKMVGLFAQNDYHGLQFEFLAHRTEYFEFDTLAKNATDPTQQAGYFEIADLIKTSWMQGLHLTPQISLQGSTMLSPNPIRYTKPIVLLIDELSGSGGDAFPAMMKQLGRATLFGTNTMGAGGHVSMSFMPLPYSANKFNITKSLIYPHGGAAVENNGVAPHVQYSITANDFENGYLDYQLAYLTELLTRVRSQK